MRPVKDVRKKNKNVLASAKLSLRSNGHGVQDLRYNEGRELLTPILFNFLSYRLSHRVHETARGFAVGETDTQTYTGPYRLCLHVAIHLFFSLDVYLPHGASLPNIEIPNNTNVSVSSLVSKSTYNLNLNLYTHARTGFRIIRTLCRLSQSYSSKSVFLG